MRVRYSMDASACDVETATRDGTLTRNRWTHWASPQDKSSAQQRAVERNAERLPYNINQTSNIIVDTMTISKPSQTPRFKGNFKNWIVDTETFYVTVWLMLCNLLLMLHFFFTDEQTPDLFLVQYFSVLRASVQQGHSYRVVNVLRKNTQSITSGMIGRRHITNPT